jgi:excisionase family DNA binding protein
MSETTTTPVSVRPKKAAEMLGISRLKVYHLIRDNKLRSVKDGNTRLVPVAAIHEYLASLEAPAK